MKSLLRRLNRAPSFQFLEAAMAARWHAALLRRAVDVTPAARSRIALVLAPHADDETLGCGATIALKTEFGTRVVIAIATDGRHSHGSRLLSPDAIAALRRAEAVKAAKALGVAPADLRFLGFTDGALERRMGALEAALDALLTEEAPDEVMMPALPDWNSDHAALNRAMRAVAARRGWNGRLCEYPIWFWTLRSWIPAPRSLGKRTVEKVVCGAMLARKRQALSVYRSQVSNLTHEPDWAILPAPFLAHFDQPAELFLIP